MGSLKKKAINASTKLKHSLKKLMSLDKPGTDISGGKRRRSLRGEERRAQRMCISFLRKQLDHKRFKELLELHHNKHVGSVCNSCQGSS
ncbi:hypothetical protein HID58_088575 [Brassica napus]|uniref:Uncharacterized protein n=1 Tax=Brassica napus TaxID=3708 RepID=A0ABQ7XWM7_BRANA|nr:hypothetical protein HID58_088575 [Brassica napus]